MITEEELKEIFNNNKIKGELRKKFFNKQLKLKKENKEI